MATTADTKQPFFELRSHLFYHVAIVITAFVIFLFVPLFILTPGQTKQFINNGRELLVVSDVAILVASFCLIMSALYWVLSFLKLRDIGGTLVMLVLSWVALSGFLLPLTTANGMAELRFAPTHWLNLSIVTLLASICTIFFMSRFTKAAQIFMGIFLTVSILPTLPAAFSMFEKHEKGAKAVSLSADKNILLVGFDGLPGHLVKDVLASTPEFARTFKDFTYYENASSSSPGTDASVLGIVYGNYDFTKWEDHSKIDKDELYFNQSEKINFTSSYKYNLYNKSGTKLTAGQYGKAEQRDQLFEMYRNVAVRLTTTYGLVFMDGIDHQLFQNRNGKFYTTVSGYDRVVDSLIVDSDKPSVFYSHFTFTHRPPTMDENCGDRSMDPKWMSAHQNIEGLRTGTICGLKKYTELIDRLKQLGVYDQTMIILLSDHGKTLEFYNTPPHNLAINNGPELGYDRYRPFLMIKPIGQAQDGLAISDKNVVLDDLAQTNCNVFESASFCEQRPGLNILDDRDIAPDDFYIHVVKDEQSSWMVVDHKAVKISRQIPLVDAMTASNEIELSVRP